MSDTQHHTHALDALREELRARDAAWSAAAPSGMDEVRGEDALRAYVTASTAIPGFRISWRPVRSSSPTTARWPGSAAPTVSR